MRYSLLLGNKGPATREQVDELRRLILSRQSTNPVLRAFGPELEVFLEDLDELEQRQGQGGEVGPGAGQCRHLLEARIRYRHHTRLSAPPVLFFL